MSNTIGNSEKTDKELIDGYLRGNHGDFELLYNRYKCVLYGYLNMMLPMQHGVVDDIFQQTWIKVIEKMSDYQCSNKFRAWMTRIAHNLAIDHFRRNKKFKNSISLDDEDAPDIADNSSQHWEEMDDSRMRLSISDAIKTLQDEQREVFIMRQNKISFKEIAIIQKSSINTVLARMQYAIKNIKKHLAEKAIEEGMIK